MAPIYQRVVFRAIYIWARLIRPCFARLEVSRDGAEGFAPLPPCVIAANHRSFFDIPVGFEYFGRTGSVPAIVVADRFFRIPVIGQLLRAIGALRAKKGGAEQLVADGLVELGKGRNVAIFPEGRLVPQGERLAGVGKAYTTLIEIARQGHVPIIPIGVAGSDGIWPLGRPLPRFRLHRPSVTARVGAPIWVGDDEDNGAALTRLMDAIATMIDALE